MGGGFLGGRDRQAVPSGECGEDVGRAELLDDRSQRLVRPPVLRIASGVGAS
jgi:hypothetical protein